MPDLILYHNPRWGKSRGAVSLLKEHNLDFSIVEYLKTPLTPSEIIALSKKLGKAPGEFVRKNEAGFVIRNKKELVKLFVKLNKALAIESLERPADVKSNFIIITSYLIKLLLH